MNPALEFNRLSPEFQANPYSFFDALRETVPVSYWDSWRMWFLTRYDDVAAALKEPRLGHEIMRSMSNDAADVGERLDTIMPIYEVQNQWMLLKDPPDHTRLRTLVHKAFTPRMVERLRERAQATADGLIDQMAARSAGDLIADFALPLPVTVIAEMLGVPPADYDRLHGWSRGIGETLELNESMEEEGRGLQATVEFSAYLRDLIGECRAELRFERAAKEDLISALVAAEAEGDKLSEDEMVAMCVLLLASGHETTVNLIGNGMLALLRHPDQWAKLKAEPSLVRLAVEELLRYDSPIQLTTRWVMDDFEFAGQRFRKGQRVIMLFGAANRDPSRFANANALDITRDPNPHIAFGSGIHFCLGAPLARMEGQIAFATLAKRLPNLQLASENPPYRDTFVLRGLRELPVTF